MPTISFDDLIPPQNRQQKSAISFDDLIPAEKPSNGIADTVDAFGRGAANMAGLGFMDEVGAAARYAGGKIFPWQPEVTYDQALAEVRGDDKRLAEEHPVADIAGKVTGAVGLGTGLARAGLSPTSRAIDAGAGLARTTAASALEGGALGAVQGAGDSEGELVDRAENAAYGLAGGAAIGGFTPAVMSVAGSLARKAVSPFLTNPERTRAVESLAREGIETTAGQRVGSDGLRYAESEIGGQTARELVERQSEQFTAAALRRAGITANRATPEVIDDAFRSIGQQFDDLAARNNLVPDNQLAQDMGDVWRQYASMTPENARVPAVWENLQDIGRRLQQGPLEGGAYQAARSRLDRLARKSYNDPQLQQAFYGLRNALDDGMERTLSVSNPADVGLWREARNSWRNMLVLEKAATSAGENAANGLISPSALRNATVSTHGRRNYARGQGDFAELARSGEAIMKPMPNSGTAGRLNAQNVGLGLAGLAGAGAGTTTGDPTTAAIAGIAGLLAPRTAGRMMMSQPVQRYLSNQSAAAFLRLKPMERKIAQLLMNIAPSEEADDAGRLLLGR